MFDFFLIIIALGMGAAGAGGPSTESAQVASQTQPANDGLLSGTEEGAVSGGAAVSQYVAEPQTPSGKFTTATEIKPIMGATKGNWVAVREYDGNDLVYFTHLLSWRCGLVGIEYRINGGPVQNWPLAPCQVDTAQPNAIPQDAQIYAVHPLKSVEMLDVEIIYDDLSRDSASFQRNQVLMP